MPSRSFARNKDQSNRHRAAGPSSCADRMAADQARFCSLRRSPSDPSAPAPKRRRTAPDGPPARNRPPPPATVVSDQLSKDEHVCSCLNGIRFVPKMPPLLGHAPSAARGRPAAFREPSANGQLELHLLTLDSVIVER